jgi:hypothetical protein
MNLLYIIAAIGAIGYLILSAARVRQGPDDTYEALRNILYWIFIIGFAGIVLALVGTK